MIAVSAALVMAALGLLVAGIIVPYMVLIYLSIGVSVLAALLLGIGAFQRRGELFGPESTTSAEAQHGSEHAVTAVKTDALVGATSAEAGRTSPRAPTSASHPETQTQDDAPPTPSPAAATATIPADAPVSVTPARGTYHLANCRQLRGRTHTTLTYTQAREDGYTACSSCLPDTVLAARGETATAAPDDSDDTLTAHTAQSSSDVTAGVPGETAAPAYSDADERHAAASGVAHSASGETATEDAYAPHDAGEVLHAGTDNGDAVPAAGADETDLGESEGQAGLVGVVNGSHRYHRLTCAVVEDAVQDGIELTTMGRGEAEDEQCTPCTVCRP